MTQIPLVHAPPPDDSIPSFALQGVGRTGWRLLPTDRDALVEFHRAGEVLIREDVPQRAYVLATSEYARFLVHLGVLEDCQRTNLVRASSLCEQRSAKALFHRLNCQTLRFISGLSTCVMPCCCHCMGAYPDIACTALPDFDETIEDSDISNN